MNLLSQSHHELFLFPVPQQGIFPLVSGSLKFSAFSNSSNIFSYLQFWYKSSNSGHFARPAIFP